VADAILTEAPSVAIGAGAHGVNLHLDPADLVRLLGADVADVTRAAS
jgi:prolyl-tRNA editing enzyme YbaK/EbsC (Cys-tRNA(Pro) deacylase)